MGRPQAAGGRDQRVSHIITHSANAEFGGALGSTTNIITRSGTNHVHGTLWEFLRNDAVDTNNCSRRRRSHKAKSVWRHGRCADQKEKTFIFGFYEGFTQSPGRGRADHGAVAEAAYRRFLQNSARRASRMASATTRRTSFPTSSPMHRTRITLCRRARSSSGFTNPAELLPLPNAGTNLFSTTQTLSNNTDQFGTAKLTITSIQATC